jgi:F0F1-type ATP synthase assembly protein I
MKGEPLDPVPGSGPESEDRREARKLARYAGVGLQFAASILVFLYLGKWVDGRLGSAPWGLIIGVFTGAGAAFYSMYTKLMADLRDDEARRRR